MDGYRWLVRPIDVQGVEKDNKAARQYFETAAHLVQQTVESLNSG